MSRIRPDLPIDCVCESATSGRGLRLILSDFFEDLTSTKVLVELFTESPSYYGRYLALVVMGVGCTVWYLVEPVSTAQETFKTGGQVLGNEVTRVNFTHLDYQPPGFKIAKYIETGNVSLVVESVMKEKPFIDLVIPASGLALTAAGLGLKNGI